MNPPIPPITFTPAFANEGDSPAAQPQPTASSVIAQIDENSRAAADLQAQEEGARAAMKARVQEKMQTYYKADMTLQFALALAPHVVSDRLHNGTHENQAKLLWSMAEAMATGAPDWVVEGINSVG